MTAGNGVGWSIRTLRAKAGLTLREVSESAGVGLRYLNQVENGIETPSPKWIAHVVEVIGEHLEQKAA